MTAAAIMTGIAFLIAWLLIPMIVIGYWWYFVPRRHDEIVYMLVRGPEGPLDQSDPEYDRNKNAAWHYFRLYHPDKIPSKKDERAFIEQEFWHYHDWTRYILPLFLIMVLSGMMLVFSGLWIADRLHLSVSFGKGSNPLAFTISNTQNAPGVPAAKPAEAGKEGTPVEKPARVLSLIDSSFIMALLGAWVWSLYEVLSRSKTGDLTPLELYDIVLRFVTAIPVGYAFSLLVFDRVSPWLAFAVSAFPLRDIRQLMRKQALKKAGDTSSSKRSTADQSRIGQTLSGISDDTIVRLEELNIFTGLDLAYTDPVKLMVKTGAPLKLVLGWIDKALLAVYATPHITQLERVGMPCALDVCEFYADHIYDIAKKKHRNWHEDTAVHALEKELKMPKELLACMIENVFTDPHTQFLIRAWYGPTTNPDQI